MPLLFIGCAVLYPSINILVCNLFMFFSSIRERSSLSDAVTSRSPLLVRQVQLILTGTFLFIDTVLFKSESYDVSHTFSIFFLEQVVPQCGHGNSLFISFLSRLTASSHKVISLPQDGQEKTSLQI